MTRRPTINRPAAVVISSHVARGTVGNRAAVFALEALGFPVWAVPTVTLPWHPGHGPAPRIVPGAAEFSDFMAALATSPHLAEIGAVLTGYLGAAEQAEPIAEFVSAVRRANPDAIHVCDPVIGDSGGLYVPEPVAKAIRDRLFASADIVTPNLFEFGWLTGTGAESNEAIGKAAAGLGARHVVVTSAHPLLAGGTGNLLIGDGRATLAEHRRIDNPPNGTGDLTAALFMAHLLNGGTPQEALHMATASVFELVARACKRGADELMPEVDQASLRRPTAMVQMRQLSRAVPPRPA
ncbi:pyridoxal kinase PdxY [Oricola thermophila]|uniref:pyridoxal kinase n=1 Tax=Oricola thermophila TaxID=2742145 RepID=A0A6N1VGS0_9HYPH|nr:pyridoxal kinase PdxY [Oricola thermophila]QKV20100.1 pyridoxal kinase PdxY [Oricola thermophila]